MLGSGARPREVVTRDRSASASRCCSTRPWPWPWPCAGAARGDGRTWPWPLGWEGKLVAARCERSDGPLGVTVGLARCRGEPPDQIQNWSSSACNRGSTTRLSVTDESASTQPRDVPFGRSRSLPRSVTRGAPIPRGVRLPAGLQPSGVTSRRNRAVLGRLLDDGARHPLSSSRKVARPSWDRVQVPLPGWRARGHPLRFRPCLPRKPSWVGGPSSDRGHATHNWTGEGVR